MKTKEKYIADGKHFETFEQVERYATEKGLRVSNTETIRKNTYLITLNK